MKPFASVLAFVVTAISTIQGCLVLEGTYYTVNNQLIVNLTDNGNQLCSWVGTFTFSNVYLHCHDGHYAWIRQPSWPERPEWDAAYAHAGQNYHFFVDGSPITSSGGNREVGSRLYAANYGC